MELHRNWRDLLARMQKASKRSRTYAILTVRVIVDEDGIPILWDDPEYKALEPRYSIDYLQRIMKIGK